MTETRNGAIQADITSSGVDFSLSGGLGLALTFTGLTPPPAHFP